VSQKPYSFVRLIWVSANGKTIEYNSVKRWNWVNHSKVKYSRSKKSAWHNMIVRHVHWYLWLENDALVDELYNYGVIGNVKNIRYILWNFDLMLFSIIWCIHLKWAYLCIFCWTMMIVSFDTRTNYDVVSEEHVTQGWGGRGGGLRGKIRPSVIYLCFVLVGTNLRFRYDFGSMLYLFP